MIEDLEPVDNGPAYGTMVDTPAVYRYEQEDVLDEEGNVIGTQNIGEPILVSEATYRPRYFADILNDMRCQKTGDYYFAVVVPIEMLGMEVPVGIEQNGWDKIEDTPAEYDEEGNVTTEATYRQKKFGEFFMTWWPCADGKHVLARMCAMQSPIKRVKRMSAEECQMFVEPATALGIAPEQWILGREQLIGARGYLCTPKGEEDETEG